MDALDLARWQFGITTVYHFIFVPLTIGLSLLVAIMQTIAVRAKDPVKADSWTRITKFFGSMLIVNFGIGIATGIVQEFQFGMNWSEYSRFMGDIFGAPLALEGLAAFFMESTFLGLWIFGWNRLPKGLHLLTIWMVAIGTTLSAYFIIAANSFMQHPVAAVFNPETGRAELDPSQGGIFALLTNVTTLAAFPHVIAGAWLVAGCFVTGIAAWHMVKNHKRAEDQTLSGEEQAAAGHLAKNVWRPATRFGVLVMVLSAGGLLASGDFQGKLMFEQQPMKMASAEALCHTETGANFSILSVAGPRAFSQDCTDISHIIEIPYVTSILATNDPNATLKGVTELNAEYKEKFGATAVDASGKTVDVDYRPNLFVTYWSFRLMIGLGLDLVCALCPVCDPHAVHRQRLRLDLHRDGPPAVDRRTVTHRRPARAAAHDAGRLRPRRLAGNRFARGLHASVRRACGRLVLPHAQPGPQGHQGSALALREGECSSR